jgi:rubredoxin
MIIFAKSLAREGHMMIYACELCGYEYNPKAGDPENGIVPGTDFEDLPEDWVCPLCGATKVDFEAIKKDKDYD